MSEGRGGALFSCVQKEQRGGVGEEGGGGDRGKLRSGDATLRQGPLCRGAREEGPGWCAAYCRRACACLRAQTGEEEGRGGSDLGWGREGPGGRSARPEGAGGWARRGAAWAGKGWPAQAREGEREVGLRAQLEGEEGVLLFLIRI